MIAWIAEEGPEREEAELRLVASDGRVGRLIAEVRQQLDPRRALALIAQAKGRAAAPPSVVVVPWMSSATRSLFVEGGLSFLDLTGYIRVCFSEPGLFIASSDAERDPWPEVSGVSLRGAKAARVVRALATARLPQGVRALAEQAGTTPGYVAKLLGFLDGQAVVQRSTGGQVTTVDLRRLIGRWAEQAPARSPRPVDDLDEDCDGAVERPCPSGEVGAKSGCSTGGRDERAPLAGVIGYVAVVLHRRRRRSLHLGAPITGKAGVVARWTRCS